MNKIAHVGLGKTGSTYLQRHIFPKLTLTYFSTDSYLTWPKPLNWIYEINKYWVQDLYAQKGINARKAREEIFVRIIEKKIDGWVSSSKSWFQKISTPTIISAEGFSGFSLQAAEMTGHILCEMGINKIIFVYRNQIDWSLSLWSQLVQKENRFLRHLEYEKLFGNVKNNFLDAVIDMNWAEYLELYQSKFGKENILAIPYELLIEDPDAFCQHIHTFVGGLNTNNYSKNKIENPSLKINKYQRFRFDDFALFIKLPKLRYLTNRLVSLINENSFLARLLLKEYQVPNLSLKEKEEIMSKFQVSNRKLASLSGFDLSKYGYY